MSLLDVNANVDLGLDLAAPVDLAAAANLNVAAPIEAAASANVLSPDAVGVSEAQQTGSIQQGITGDAHAVAPQTATVAQDSSGGTTGATERRDRRHGRSDHGRRSRTRLRATRPLRPRAPRPAAPTRC